MLAFTDEEIIEGVLAEFQPIANIPRPSGHEKAVSDYLKGLFESMGCQVVQDASNNIIADMAASAGKENVPLTIMQAHMDMVCVAEAQIAGQFVYIDLLAFVADVCLSPCSKDADVHNDGKDEVEKNSSSHDKESLPCRFCPEFPWLRFAFQLLSVHRLVDHSADLAVASERKPADTVFGLPLCSLRADLEEPFAFCAEQLYSPCIKEEVELVHLDAEDLGEEKVAELMNENEYSECKYHLQGFHQYYHLF